MNILDQDEITAQVYQIMKNNPAFSSSQVMEKIRQELPDVPIYRFLISLKHLSEA